MPQAPQGQGQIGWNFDEQSVYIVKPVIHISRFHQLHTAFHMIPTCQISNPSFEKEQMHHENR